MKQFYNHNMNEELLTRYLLGETDEEENTLIGEWLLQDPANNRQLGQIRTVLDMVELTRIDETASWNNFKTKLQPQTKHVTMDVAKPKSSILRWAVAASILILIGISSIYFYNVSGSKLVIAQSSDEQLDINLKDGSQVTLNRNSELSYPKRFARNERKVFLKGDAFFSIEPNPEKPFIIDAGDLNVTVLGTSFYVSAREGETPQVLVETGTVECLYKPTGEKTILKAGETATFGNNQIEKKTVTNQDMNAFAWKTYRLVFQDEKLSEIVKLVNKAYGSKIEIEGDVRDCHLTVNFEQLNIDGIINVLQSILDIDFSKSKDKIILKGEGCQ